MKNFYQTEQAEIREILREEKAQIEREDQAKLAQEQAELEETEQTEEEIEADRAVVQKFRQKWLLRKAPTLSDKVQ